MRPVLLWMTLFAFCNTAIAADDLTDADTIVRKANHVAFYQGTDGKATARMLIVDSQDRKQFRQFSIARKDINDGGDDGHADGDQSFFVYFHRPADVKKTAFLVNKHLDRDDDRWLYLPSLDLVKRIAAGDKRTSFVGSHFYYEDVSGRQLDEDHHRLKETTNKHYVIEAKPKKPDSVEFSSYQVWINKENFVPEKTVYFDQQGKAYRTVEAVEIETVQGFPTATKMRIDDQKSGGYTLMELRDIHYDVGLSADHFSERSLRNPPPDLIQ
ncbi:MAG: outer membrane lipoprotein-sorting protein [Ketobacteraceae bacterium]|nr:outer membrane lipoprotein-sorting protein [Ketobacteraceae bacterium]